MLQRLQTSELLFTGKCGYFCIFCQTAAGWTDCGLSGCCLSASFGPSDVHGGFNHPPKSLPVHSHSQTMPVCDFCSQDAFYCSSVKVDKHLMLDLSPPMFPSFYHAGNVWWSRCRQGCVFLFCSTLKVSRTIVVFFLSREAEPGEHGLHDWQFYTVNTNLRRNASPVL